ncbi:MAG: hypothetical protein MZV64_27690 [Ignavibacteriales bacterium]|nr:hypothetical protein [Ignavibacteriales bacterium]
MPLYIGYLPLWDNAKIEIDQNKFEKLTIIFSDKQEQKINIQQFLAQELIKNQDKVVILDFTGIFFANSFK